MKLSARQTVQRLVTVVAAGVFTLAVSGCGDEPQPKPAAKTVPPPAAPQAEAKTAPEKPAVESARAANDQALAAKVKSALAAAPGLNSHRIDVTVKDGAVTLFGTAESRHQQEAAAKIAAAVAGVKSVENRLALVAGS